MAVLCRILLVLVADLDDTDDKAREALLDLFYAAMVMKTGATDLRALTNEALRRELMVCARCLSIAGHFTQNNPLLNSF